MIDATFGFVLIAWALAGGSPGPATLSIAGAAMQQGRVAGLATASGVLVGSASWGVAAAFGMSAIMLANAWLVEIIRYVGAGYLLYLGLKAARSALQDKPMRIGNIKDTSAKKHFIRGFLIHITNPKAIFSWGAMFAVVVPPGSGLPDVLTALFLLFVVSMVVFLGYALVFSTQRAQAVYNKARRGFDLLFGAVFGAAGLMLITERN